VSRTRPIRVEPLTRLRPLIPTPLLRLAYRFGIHVMRVYWFIARPHTRGVKVVVRNEGRVLLVRHTYGDRHWDLPGGTADGDEAPADTVVREMREELGVSPMTLRLMRATHWRPSGKHDQVTLFVADVPDRDLRVEAAEIAATRWVAPDAIPDGTARLARAAIARAFWPEDLG
jgi:8-oxo-dGTP pyrophosphatase MutT (NUDIX family)